VTATSLRTLLGWAAVGVALGWLVARLSWVVRGEVGDVPLSAAIVLFAAGAALIFTAIRTRHRLEGRAGTKRLPPMVGARLAALALAASRVGAGVGGGYLGYGAFVLGDLGTAYRKEILLHSGLCIVGAVLVVVGALLLERVLRLPEDSDEAHLTV
jgi:Protein of unknown function (DUF3180)